MASLDVPRQRWQQSYDRLWSKAVGRIRTGEVELDPILAAGVPDRRRGLTVIARPSVGVRQRVTAFLSQLRGIEPDQYFYAPSEFHVTVLSLFTAAVESDRFFAQTREYVAAVDAALRNVAPMRVEFAGVTASSSAILAQGFCENEALNEVREALRRQLRDRGLAEGLDRRYRLETAHMTVVRFRARLRDSERFAAVLEAARRLPFGAANIGSVSLVKNDWYMTRQIVKTVARYRLAAGTRPIHLFAGSFRNPLAKRWDAWRS